MTDRQPATSGYVIERMATAYGVRKSLMADAEAGVLARAHFDEFLGTLGGFVVDSRLHKQRLTEETVRKGAGELAVAGFHLFNSLIAKAGLRQLPNALTEIDEELKAMLSGTIVEATPRLGVLSSKAIRPLNGTAEPTFVSSTIGVSGEFDGANAGMGRMRLLNRGGATYEVTVVGTDLRTGDIVPFVDLDITPVGPEELPRPSLD